MMISIYETPNTLKAREWASRLHELRNISYDNQSYEIGHLLPVVRVATLFLTLCFVEDELKEDIICACWCHDVIEDCAVTYNDVVRIIGTFAADIVYDVTDELGKNRVQRHARTYPKIKANEYAVFVKICDRIANTNASKKSGHGMMEKYKSEFPSFYENLHQPGLWEPMWDLLKEITFDPESSFELE